MMRTLVKRMHWICVFVIALMIGSSVSARAASSKMNVVLLLTDNQSYYEMSCHGNDQIKTPNIDRLASEGVDFQRFYAPPYCSPSRTEMLTGKFAMRLGVYTTVGGRSIMHKGHDTIADVLRRSGYGTAIFGKWHLGFNYPYRPEDRGFDEVFVHRGGGIGQLEDYFGNTHHDAMFFHNGSESPSTGYSSDVLFDRAMTWIEEQGEKPFFCFVSTPAPHFPYQGPKDGDGNDTGLNGMIENIDVNVGRMMKKLDQLGLNKNTILIFASDQGMNRRGLNVEKLKRTPGHDENHHSPFIVRGPAVKPHINTRLTGMIDFFPTVLDLCGIDIPSGLDGVSLKPLLMGSEEDYLEDRTLIIQCPRGREVRKWHNASVKTDRWRFVNGEELYDVTKDPMTLNNVASNYPGVVRELTAKYEKFWESLPDPDSTLPRQYIGAEKMAAVTLNAMDWYRGAHPWNSRSFGRNPKSDQNGAWPVTVLNDGNYSFELRRYPREADRAIGLTQAKIMIGDLVAEKGLGREDQAVAFELELKAGDYDLQSWLWSEDAPDTDYGALFVYVNSR